MQRAHGDRPGLYVREGGGSRSLKGVLGPSPISRKISNKKRAARKAKAKAKAKAQAQAAEEAGTQRKAMEEEEAERARVAAVAERAGVAAVAMKVEEAERARVAAVAMEVVEAERASVMSVEAERMREEEEAERAREAERMQRVVEVIGEAGIHNLLKLQAQNLIPTVCLMMKVKETERVQGAPPEEEGLAVMSDDRVSTPPPLSMTPGGMDAVE